MAQPPTRLGDFELIRELGRGGMGVVYEARQTSLNRRVALKLLGAGLGLTPRAVDRFRREAEAAARLHHSNIVPVHATGEEGGIHFYAMEFVDGPSLDVVIRQMRAGPSADASTESAADLDATGEYSPSAPTPLPTGSGSETGSSAGRFDRAASMVADVADALQHAHQNGVLHRDVKPANLMLCLDGRLSVTDFGLARLLERPGVTATGEFVGTPAYMSPEQITAGRIPVDHRTDVYSLGATFYHLLTLRRPFEAEGRDRLLAMVIQKDPAAPRSIDPKIPRDLETVCLKCLEKDPDRRYQSAKDLAEDLRRFVGRFAILAKRTGSFGRLKKWAKRNPALSAAVLTALIAAASAAAFAWRAHDAEQRRMTDQMRRDAEVVQEMRRSAIERAMVAALAADLPGAEKAVAEAELLGASPGETRMLRGFIAFHNGRSAEAIAYLEQAVRLMPGRVAPLALLTITYYFDGDPSHVISSAELESMSSETSEDELFKGAAIAIARPAEGLRLIDEALAARPSTLGHVLRADARLHLAEASGTIPDAEAAIVAADFAKQLLPDNPERLGKSCYALLRAMSAHEMAGHRVKAVEYLDAARREAANLARFDRNPKAIAYRIDVALAVDGLDGKLDRTAELRAARTGRRDPLLTLYEAYNWFCLGNDREVDLVAGEMPLSSTCYYRALATLGRPNGRPAALAAINEFAGADSPWRQRFSTLPLLYAVDRGTFSTVVTRLQREREPPSIWGSAEMRQRALAMLDGKISEQDYLAVPAHDQFDLFRRQEVVAWKRLGDGDREGSRRAFEKAYRLNLFDDPGWFMCRAVLIRMKDPNWPQALLAKKQ